MEVVFDEVQQELVNKLVGEARTKAREKARTEFTEKAAKDEREAERVALAGREEWQKLAQQHEDRVKELEPLVAQVEAYRNLIAGMLKDKVKELGDAAKNAMAALPDTLSALEKLHWLNANQALFETDEGTSRVGTPIKGKKLQKTGKQPEGYRPVHL